jgi:alpha-acetolactate decarboxylase
MKNTKMKDGLDLMGSYGTPDVLEYIGDNPHCKREELEGVVIGISVADLVEQLSTAGLIIVDLHLTEKGRKALGKLQKLKVLLKN